MTVLWGTHGFHTSSADVGLVEEKKEDVPLFVIPRGVILLIGLVGFCGIYAEVAAQDWSSVYMHRTLHGDEAEAAFTTGMFAFTMAAGRLSGDAVVGRLGATTTVRACGVFGAIGGLLVVAAHSPIPAIIGFMLIGVGVSVVVPLAFAAAGHAGPNPTMGVAGVATIAYGAGMAAPGMIGGIADLTSLRVAFCAVAVLAGMVALAAGCWDGTRQRRCTACQGLGPWRPRRWPPKADSAAPHPALKYLASGWWAMIASVDCSGCSWNSSDSSTPIRSGFSSSTIFARSSRSGQAG